MEIKSEFRKKLLSSLANITLVLSILIVLMPLSMPKAEATTHYIWGNWVVTGLESYSGDTFILYGDLDITTGTLNLSNCNLEMAYAGNVSGNTIHVGDSGTFNLLNNSLITTYSTSPDPYEFRIDGTA